MTTAPIDDVRNIAPVADEVMPVALIVEGERTRKHLSGIQGLADSIQRFGLITPLVIDGDNTLLAGGRRLAAVRKLGWETVSVRRYADLTDRERLDIEVEENERRQDLSGVERNEAIARMAKLARRVAADEAEWAADEFRAAAARNTVGRPPVPGSLRDVGRRLNVSESSIRYAEEMVACLERYPALRRYSGRVSIAAKLDAMAQTEREQWLKRFQETAQLPEGRLPGAARSALETEFYGALRKAAAAAERAERKRQQAAAPKKAAEKPPLALVIPPHLVEGYRDSALMWPLRRMRDDILKYDAEAIAPELSTEMYAELALIGADICGWFARAKDARP